MNEADHHRLLFCLSISGFRIIFISHIFFCDQVVDTLIKHLSKAPFWLLLIKIGVARGTILQGHVKLQSQSSVQLNFLAQTTYF